MSSAEHPVQRTAGPEDAYTAPSVSGWIRDSATRHWVTLLVATLVVAAADALGANVDIRVYGVMAAWIGVNAGMAPWAARPHDYRVRLRRYAVTLVVDIGFLSLAYYFLDALLYAGAAFFTYQALVASATLPRRWGLGIAALAVVAYGGLVVLAVSGRGAAVSPVGLPSVAGNRIFAVGAVASAAGMIVLLIYLQMRLIQSIRDAERRYVTLVQAASDMVVTFDERGRFLDANPATLEQSGYSWAELKTLPTSGFFAESDWPRVLDAFRRTMAGESQRMVVRIVRKDGAERWVEGASSLLRIGDQPAVVVIARDVTAAHRQAEEMRQRDTRLSLVLDALQAGFIAVDRDLRITAAFGEWARAREARGERLIGRKATELNASREILARHEEVLPRVWAGESVSLSWTAATPAGERLMRSQIVPMRDNTGTVTGVAALFVDETDQARAEREREELRRRVADADRVESLGKLVSGVAHELNNPLAAILSFAEDLLAEARAPEERLAIEVIQAQALRSRTIVRDLLTYARSDVSRPRTPTAPVPILYALARAMRPGLATQGVQFVVELGDANPEIPLDRTGFEQVVTNLLTNAAHAAGSGGSVRLSSRVRGDAFEVLVEDNGAGIPPEVASRMFEPFFTTKPTGHGVGLGLSVSMGIVRAHGGTLTAENRPASAGGGARFILRLPLSDAAAVEPGPGGGREAGTPAGEALPRPGAAAVAEPPSQPRSMPERKPTILIIDDEGAIRQGLRRYFTRRGWMVEDSPDGADALSRLLRPDAMRIYDVVICDLKMPGVSGMDVYDRVLAAAPAMARRFVLSTGDTSAPDVAGFLSQVAVPVLEKPFELTLLESLAEQVRSGNGSSTAPASPAPA